MVGSKKKILNFFLNFLKTISILSLINFTLFNDIDKFN